MKGLVWMSWTMHLKLVHILGLKGVRRLPHIISSHHNQSHLHYCNHYPLHASSPFDASWPCSSLPSLLAPPLYSSPEDSLSEAAELQGSVQSSGCEVTEAACIYRLSEQRNVLLTVEAIYRAFLLMAQSIVEERRWFSWEFLTRLPHISSYPHSMHIHSYFSHISACFTPSILLFPDLPHLLFIPPAILPFPIY